MKDKLQIVLITYNRHKYLENTLSQILSEDSPIKDFDITIIDNNSTDDTADVAGRYLEKFSNLKYVKNKFNIGGNANIVRAFEMANREYIWVLADNDEYDWTFWHEVEEGIAAGEDAIVVALFNKPYINKAHLFNQTSFLPGVIYKSSILDDTVFGNMEFNISNLFPHLMVSAKLINEDANFKILSHPIVIMGDNNVSEEPNVYVRGYCDKNIHPLMGGMNWLAGYANSLHIIKNKKLRGLMASETYLGPIYSAKALFYNEQHYGNLYNLFCIYSVLNTFQRIRFILNLILFNTIYRIVYIYRTEVFDVKNDICNVSFNIRLFNLIKTRLLKFQTKGELA